MNGNERLLVLAAALRANAANPTGAKFDLGEWIDFSGVGPKPAKNTALPINCGTVVCAVGLACILPELRAEGLSWTFSHDHKAGYPEFENDCAWGAVEEFFSVNRDESVHLFNSVSYDGPTKGAEAELAVADRIEEFVAARS